MALEFKDLGKLKWYYQALLVAAICGGALAAVWYYYLTPIQVTIEQDTQKVNELRALVAKSEARQKELALMKQQLVELQAQLDAQKKRLPLERETDQIFRSVQAQAELSGLRVSRVTPRPVNPTEVYDEVPYELEVTGTFHNVGTFLDRIRQMDRIVNIGGMQFQSRASEGDLAFTSSVGARYTATTFVYKEEQPAPAAK